MQCNTVKIKDKENGYLTINESDYNDELHTLFADIKPEVKEVKQVKKTRR